MDIRRFSCSLISDLLVNITLVNASSIPVTLLIDFGIINEQVSY